MYLTGTEDVEQRSARAREKTTQARDRRFCFPRNYQAERSVMPSPAQSSPGHAATML